MLGVKALAAVATVLALCLYQLQASANPFPSEEENLPPKEETPGGPTSPGTPFDPPPATAVSQDSPADPWTTTAVSSPLSPETGEVVGRGGRLQRSGAMGCALQFDAPEGRYLPNRRVRAAMAGSSAVPDGHPFSLSPVPLLISTGAWPLFATDEEDRQSLSRLAPTERDAEIGRRYRSHLPRVHESFLSDRSGRGLSDVELIVWNDRWEQLSLPRPAEGARPLTGVEEESPFINDATAMNPPLLETSTTTTTAPPRTITTAGSLASPGEPDGASPRDEIEVLVSEREHSSSADEGVSPAPASPSGSSPSPRASVGDDLLQSPSQPDRGLRRTRQIAGLEEPSSDDEEVWRRRCASLRTRRVTRERRRQQPRYPCVPEDTRVAQLYRQLVCDVLRAPSPAHQSDEESEPEDADGALVEAILHLEEWRPRPPANSSGGHPGSEERLPATVDNLYPDSVGIRNWAVIPRGACSEWFPPPPNASASDACPGCTISERVEELRAQDRRNAWRDFANRNDRVNESALGLVSPFDNDERARCRYAVVQHNCALGLPVSLPLVLFTPQGQPMTVDDPSSVGIQLRVFVHLVAPCVYMNWGTEARFRGVFPLFGELRRYWGRAVMLEGEMIISGQPSDNRRAPQIRHNLHLSAHSRRPGLLRYAPLSVRATVLHGPRADVAIVGVSLQWRQHRRANRGDSRLRLPVEVSSADLTAHLLRASHPHSYLVSDTTGDTVRRPSLPLDVFDGRDPALASSGSEGEPERTAAVARPPAAARARRAPRSTPQSATSTAIAQGRPSEALPPCGRLRPRSRRAATKRSRRDP